MRDKTRQDKILSRAAACELAPYRVVLCHSSVCVCVFPSPLRRQPHTQTYTDIHRQAQTHSNRKHWRQHYTYPVPTPFLHKTRPVQLSSSALSVLAHIAHRATEWNWGDGARYGIASWPWPWPFCCDRCDRLDSCQFIHIPVGKSCWEGRRDETGRDDATLPYSAGQ